MPTLTIDVGWTEPLMVDGEVWVILSTTNCDAAAELHGEPVAAQGGR
jgi:hypothetical protein